MNSLKRKLKTSHVYVLFGLILFSNACLMNNKIESLPEIKDSKINYNPNETVSAEEIIKIVRDYWETSLEGNEEKLEQYIHQVPDNFWQRCSVKNQRDKNEADATFKQQSGDRAGEGAIVSENEKRQTLFLLKYFSTQIAQAKPELLNIKILRFTTNEAVASIKWRKKGTNFSGVEETVLLQKFEDRWKIIMMQSGSNYENIFRVFGTNQQC